MLCFILRISFSFPEIDTLSVNKFTVSHALQPRPGRTEGLMLSSETGLGVSVLKAFGCRQLVGQPQGTFHTGKFPSSTVVIKQPHH